MYKKYILLLLIIFVTTTTKTIAQELLNPAYTFSHKKTSYITLKSGKELQGNIMNVDRKKGLIEKIKIKDLNGKKHKLKPTQIKHMYLPPSGWDKLAGAYDFLHDATKWDNKSLDKDIIGRGYVYFEQSKVKIKKKTSTMLMMLLNPSFSSKVKIYLDPYAKETLSAGIGSIKLAGGIAKSYYIKKGKNPAYRIKKKNYDEEYKMLYKDCSSLVSKLDEKLQWKNLAKHVYE